MKYKLKLDIFEGPLDLLLDLSKKDDLDIGDIPIAKVTDQYMQYIEMMKLLDLDIVGDFLVMAATLMQIKSKMLLPPDPDSLVEEEEEVGIGVGVGEVDGSGMDGDRWCVPVATGAGVLDMDRLRELVKAYCGDGVRGIERV